MQTGFLRAAANVLPGFLCLTVLLAPFLGQRPCRAEEEAKPFFYAVVVSTDHTGTRTYTIVETTSKGRDIPEIKSLRETLVEAQKKAEVAYAERKKVFKADKNNEKQRFDEPKPGRASIKLEGNPHKTRAAAEATLEKKKLEEMKRSDPGKALRQRILAKYFLDHFVLGTTAPIEWFLEVRKKNGANFDIRQQYFSGGAAKNKSWDTVFMDNKWENPDKRRGVWADKFIVPSVENDIIPWITFYNLAQSNPADYKPGPSQATPRNAREKATMKSYFEQVKLCFQLCDKHKPKPVVVHFEPDEWGHLLIPTRIAGDAKKTMVPEKAVVMVGSTGLKEIKDLPDNIIGYAKAIKRLRDMYAPHVLIAVNPSAWDWHYGMSAEKWVSYCKKMGVDQWDLAVLEFGDRDIGMSGKKPPYKEEDVVTRFKNWDAMLGWIETFHKGTGLWVCMWQVAAGNTHFSSCNNTPGHHCDGLVQSILDGHPSYKLIKRFVKAGCCGWVVSPGQGDSTHVYDQRKDGVTNPAKLSGTKGEEAKYADDDGGYMRVFGGKYYKKPVKIGKQK